MSGGSRVAFTRYRDWMMNDVRNTQAYSQEAVQALQVGCQVMCGGRLLQVRSLAGDSAQLQPVPGKWDHLQEPSGVRMFLAQYRAVYTAEKPYWVVVGYTMGEVPADCFEVADPS